MREIEIKIDWTRCDGHGLCSRILPEHISLDEWGFPILDHARLTPELRSAAALAARSCPALALRLTPAPRPG